MKLRQSLFWDVNPDKIDLQKNAQYVIERVLDLGDDKEVSWLTKFYSTEMIKKVVENPRMLRPRTKNLWRLLLQNN